jgi:Na+/H+ antiporter
MATAVTLRGHVCTGAALRSDTLASPRGGGCPWRVQVEEMDLFESTLVLLCVAIGLLQVSRRFRVPYPTMLALAGVIVGALPSAPTLQIEPRLALALFIAPALLDTAYDLPPRTLRRNWLPLLALAAGAVLLTTASVAWVGLLFGLPLASAVALGAIVAPPDAAAASAMLRRFSLPRRTATILQGESLLNDAVALLIFDAAVAASRSHEPFVSLLPEVSLEVPGGVVLGIVLALVYIAASKPLAGTLGGSIFEFVATFGAWILADRLHVSAILCVVAYAMTIARYVPERQSARDRVHSYSVWGATVFLLNVLAFLLMGLQGREIVGRLHPAELWNALAVASAVLVTTIVVRLLWVMIYNRAADAFRRRRRLGAAPTISQGLVVSWCGMRGLVTLATALALPAGMPSRDTIVLSALAVVLGTLVLQGLTLGPLIERLTFPADDSFQRELSAARGTLLESALKSLEGRGDEDARRLFERYRQAHTRALDGQSEHELNDADQLHYQTILAKRETLAGLRRAGNIEDDVFHVLEQELDWAELAVTPVAQFELEEG